MLENEEEIKSAIVSFYKDIQDCLQLFELFKAGNQHLNTLSVNEEIISILRLLRKVMTNYIIMTLSRLHDRHTSDKNTLAGTIDFLRSHSNTFINNHHATDLAEAKNLWDNRPQDIEKRLRTIRNHEIAHNIQNEEVTSRATYDDLFKLLTITSQIVERLSFGTGTILVSYTSVENIHRTRADSFWKKICQ